MRYKFKVETFFCLVDTFSSNFFLLNSKQFYDDDFNSGNTATAKLAEVYKNDVCCTDVASEYKSFKLLNKIFSLFTTTV